MPQTQLCQDALDRLSKAEAEIEKLQSRRVNALLVGDNATAQAMVVRMKEVRDQATFSSYADLLMDDNQART